MCPFRCNLHESLFRDERAFVFTREIYMRKSCIYCGKSHEYNEACPKRAEYRNKYKREYKRDSLADKFRNTRIWREKRAEIQRRDLYMCRYCFCMERKITTSDLSVHHIIVLPIAIHMVLLFIN